MAELPDELSKAATDFRDTLLNRADAYANGIYPLWHGWAIFDAYVAGAMAERAAQREIDAGMLADAARYRWLRDGNAYRPEEELVDGGDQLDKLCDEAIRERKT